MLNVKCEFDEKIGSIVLLFDDKKSIYFVKKDEIDFSELIVYLGEKIDIVNYDEDVFDRVSATVKDHEGFSNIILFIKRVLEANNEAFKQVFQKIG